MIPGSRKVATVALAGSVAIHLLGAAFGPNEEQIDIAGGMSTDVTMLGNGFADLVAGTIAPITPDTSVQEDTPDKITSIEATPSEQTNNATLTEKTEVPQDTNEQAKPETSLPNLNQATVMPTVATNAKPLTTATQAVVVPVQKSLIHALPKHAMSSQILQEMVPSLTADVASHLPTEPIENTTEVVPDAPLSATETTENLTTAKNIVQQQVMPTVPKIIQPPLEREPEPTKPVQKSPSNERQGNSDQNTRRGTTQGAATSKASAASSGSANVKEAGNAAVSNYPDKVMRRISRVRRPRIKAQGAALIVFTVAENGVLASVGIHRSSGSSQLDQAALKLVRLAAPFPKPPAGARRSFSIEVKGQ